MESARENCIRSVLREGERVGAFIRRESIWFTTGADRADTTFDLEGTWSPDPTTGVSLRGGPADGEDIGIPRDEDGRPFGVLRVPHGAATAIYMRSGIDSEKDVWVYLFEADTPGITTV